MAALVVAFPRLGEGPALEIHQSDLSAFSRCAKQKEYYDLAKRGLVAAPANLSRTVYGSVVHHALQVMEGEYVQGNSQALDIALSTFAYYWNPEHTSELPGVEPVDEWLPRDTYGGYRSMGLQAIRDYFDLLQSDDSQLLALELEFAVPFEIDGVVHTIAGKVDRLSLRKQRSKWFVSIDDFKTGKIPTYLRYAAQWSMYSYASLQPEFWTPFDDANERWQAYKELPRRGRWIDLKKIKYHDCGWRGEADYARLKLALREYVRACEAGIYPLTLSGESCTYCPFRGICGGVPVPDEDHGAP